MNELERRVLRIIGEDVDAPDVFSDDDVGMAPVRDSINDALQEISMLTGGHTDTVYLPLRKDVMFYRLNLSGAHFGWVEDAWLRGIKRRLDATSMLTLAGNDPRWLDSEGEPRVYFQVGLDVVGFWPRPKATSDVVELNLALIPAAYSNDDERLFVRREYESAMVNYAVAEYWASRGDAASAEAHLTLYLAALGQRLQFSRTEERGVVSGRSE